MLEHVNSNELDALLIHIKDKPLYQARLAMAAVALFNRTARQLLKTGVVS